MKFVIQFKYKVVFSLIYISTIDGFQLLYLQLKIQNLAKSRQWLNKTSPSFSVRPKHLIFSKTPEASIKSPETKKSLTLFQTALDTGQSRKKWISVSLHGFLD